MTETKFGVTLLTGPRACSKSLVASLIALLARSGNLVWKDTSAILKAHMDHKTSVGLELLAMKDDMGQGKVLRGDIVFKAIDEWMQALRTHQNVYHVILAGSTRSPEESALWKASGIPVRVMHIGATEEQTALGTRERQKQTGCTREDETLEAIRNAWEDYNQKIIPSVAIFNGHAAHTHRSKPLRVRMTETITHMHLPQQVKRKMMERLDSDDHPAAVRVRELDAK